MVKVKIVPTSILDPLFRESPTRHTPHQRTSEEDEDAIESSDSEGEPCPFCKKLDCEDHLLACIDESGEADNRVGILDGTLYGVKEIDKIFEKICMAWVKWIRIKPKAPKPSWITSNSIILNYFESFGETSNVELNDDTSQDEDEVDYLLGEVDPYQNRTFLEDMSSRCGWTGISNREYGPDKPLQSSCYINLYDPKPKEVAEKLKSTLQEFIKQADASLSESLSR
jgi:hypothetical protein